jgi:large subunit ribosomal protein L30
MINKIKITLKKSLIGCPERQKACVRGLGLRKIRQSKIILSSKENMGMVKKISFLLDIEGVE